MDITHGLFLVLSVCALILAGLLAYKQSKHYVSSRILTPHRTLCVGLFLSALFFFIPLYWDAFVGYPDLPPRVIKTVLISAHHTIRLFVIDSDFDWIREISMDFPPVLSALFSCYGAFLFICAPVLTFGFILSFFQNFDAYRRLFLHPFADVYVFSELSERSLALAKDVKKNHKLALKNLTETKAALKEKKKLCRAAENEDARRAALAELEKAKKDYAEARHVYKNAAKRYRITKREYEATEVRYKEAESALRTARKEHGTLKSELEQKNKQGVTVTEEEQGMLERLASALAEAEKAFKQAKDSRRKAQKAFYKAEKDHKDVMILFGDVFEQNTEESYEILEKAKSLSALCFKKDVLSLRLRKRNKRSNMRFFLIAEDEEENLKQAMSITKDPFYKEKENLYLYVFSTGVAGELLLSNLSDTKAQVRRVEAARSLITYTLDNMGKRLFDEATDTDTDEKLISALVIGVGAQGTEMIKALSWYCQMDGYRVEINAFDRDPLAEEKFALKCPELYSPKYNGIYLEGEAKCKIKIHAGVSTDSISFAESIKKYKDATYIFVSQGSDDNNIRAALSLRILFARMKKSPVIQAVVYNSNTKEALNNAKNADGVKYDLELIGDLDEVYSEAVIINSELEQEAADIHCKYISGDLTEEEHLRNLFRYEYNFRSSLASALHGRLRREKGVLGANKDENELTAEERDSIERIEHRRWNAYMRAEGFVYSGSPDKKSRNNLAKMHHNLVPFDILSEEDKRKDSRVATK